MSYEGLNNSDFSRVVPMLPLHWLSERVEPDEDLVEALEECHPQARLAWDDRVGRWCLYEKVGAEYHHIATVASQGGGFEHPTYANTVGYLSEIETKIHNKWDLERWLGSLDRPESVQAEELRKKHEPQIREGSGDLYNLLLGKQQIAVPHGVPRRGGRARS